MKQGTELYVLMNGRYALGVYDDYSEVLSDWRVLQQTQSQANIEPVKFFEKGFLNDNEPESGQA